MKAYADSLTTAYHPNSSVSWDQHQVIILTFQNMEIKCCGFVNNLSESHFFPGLGIDSRI